MNASDANRQSTEAPVEQASQREQRARLQEELAAVREELQRVEKKLEQRPNFGLGQGSPDIYEWEMNLALRSRVEAKIESLEDAIQSLEEGDYGICERCGERIEPERLEILPHTTFCITCAQKLSH